MTTQGGKKEVNPTYLTWKQEDRLIKSLIIDLDTTLEAMQTPQTKEYEIGNEAARNLSTLSSSQISLCLSSLKPQFSLGCGFVQVSGTKQVTESKQNPLSKSQIFALII